MNRLQGMLLGAVVGVAVAAAVLMVLAMMRRQPALTRQRLDTQRRDWELNSVADYDIEVQVTGLRAAIYRVEVRGGVAVAATIDGRPLRQRRTFATWSVPGMFDTFASDVEAVERRASGDAAAPQLALYASFDEQFGFPKSYQRFEWSGTGAGVDVTWTVTEFTPLEPATVAP